MLFWIMLKHKNGDEFGRLADYGRSSNTAFYQAEAYISTKQAIAHEGSRTINCVQLVSFYYDRRHWTIKEYRQAAERGEANFYSLPGAIEIALDRATNNAENPDDPLYFSRYPQLVEQAGQLHI